MSAKCQSCGKSKAELNVYTSTLEPGIRLLMCLTCISKKYEPRWIIILHGRMNGWASVEMLVKKHRYCGDPILASDLIK